VRRLHATLEPWTVENGLLTPTLKLKRKQIQEKYQEAIEALYENFST
jgi:long-chain acyl-CoA synthetase